MVVLRNFLRRSLQVLWPGLVLIAAGCGDNLLPIQTFESQWHKAINRRRYERIYDLLDAVSRRQIRQELENLRGLGDVQQQFVINRLGGEKVATLSDVTPQQYFARWWHKATDGRRPKMAIEDHGGGNGYMLLSFDDQAKLRVQLMLESDRWVWRLPQQRFEPVRRARTRISGPDDMAAR